MFIQSQSLDKSQKIRKLENSNDNLSEVFLAAGSGSWLWLRGSGAWLTWLLARYDCLKIVELFRSFLMETVDAWLGDRRLLT